MTTITPNAPSTATVENAVPSLDAIAAKMTAMRETTQRNLQRESNESATGQAEEAKTARPVAPDEPKITSHNDANIDLIEEDEAPVEPEGEEVLETAEAADDEVSSDNAENSSNDELIDFIEFAETNPKAKFKFMRNGKEVVIDAKRAAAILGQGGAIHEEARQLKIEKAEFDEFQRGQKAQQEGLTLAMELTVAPQMQRAYQEIMKTQGYNQVFNEQLARTQDPAEYAKIQANIAQNDRYMQQQGEIIRRIKPNVDHFRQVRQQQVAQTIDSNRKAFKDKELRNEYVFNELREKLSKSWDQAQGETLPGIKNIDLVTADETILGLIRDGLKFRDRPQAKQAGTSLATTTRKTGAGTPNVKSEEENLNKLREQAKGRGKQATAAADNLLVAQLQKLRAARGSR